MKWKRGIIDEENEKDENEKTIYKKHYVERYMFHGTHLLDPSIIARGDLGVDWRFGGKNCWYGRG